MILCREQKEWSDTTRLYRDILRRLLLMLLFFWPVSSYATVDILCVNHITKELHTFEIENDYVGIGWESLGEGDKRLKELETGFLAVKQGKYI